MRISGANSVKEAIRAGIANKVFINDSKSKKILEIISEAKKHKVPVVKLKNFKGVEADISPIKYADFEYIVEKALRKRGLIVFLDSIQDPHNLGAVIRTAEFFGVDGIVIPKRRSVPVNETVMRVSEGAIFHIDVSRVENIATHLKKLKKMGFYIIGAEINGEDLRNAYFEFPLAIVIGGEDKGISKPVLKQCDAIIGIRGYGKTESLNLSVAYGIIMYEIRRRQI